MTILMITKVVVIRFNLLFNSALVRAKAEIMDTKMNKKKQSPWKNRVTLLRPTAASNVEISP